MTDEDFDWNSDNEDVVQQSVQGVAAYVNAANMITIRQERSWPDEDQDTIIVISIDSARRLADRLRELITSLQMN